MAIIKVKLIDPHIDRDGRYLPSGSVVNWDTLLLNHNMIPAPGLGAATTTATTAFNARADLVSVAPPIPGQPNRYKRK
jgi:hypothetical protein